MNNPQGEVNQISAMQGFSVAANPMGIASNTNFLSKEEMELRNLHDKICQSCDSCTKVRCSFTEGYHRAKKEDMAIHAPIEAALMRYCGERGDNEGQYETLERILREREILLRNAIKEKVFKLI